MSRRVASIILTVLAGTAAVLSVTALALLVYGCWIEKPHIRYEGVPFAVGPGPFRPGQVIPMQVTRCNDTKTDGVYTVAHALKNVTTGAVYVMEPRVTVIQPGCKTVTSLINVVPPGTPPGRYFLTGSALASGSLRSWIVPWHSQPFEVTQ